MWWVIALSYKEVTIAYGAPMHAMSTTKVLLLMGSSMVGSMVQLPGVGGGSQLATISAMDHVFHIVPKELAVSCGIMLWLVTFVAVVPVGLVLAHRERLSLRKLSARDRGSRRSRDGNRKLACPEPAKGSRRFCGRNPGATHRRPEPSASISFRYRFHTCG